MATLCTTIILFITSFLVASANKNGESISNLAVAASAVELKRIPKPVSDISTSDSVVRERRVLPEYRDDALDSFESIPKRSLVRSDFDTTSNGIFSETKKHAPKKSGQSSSKSGGYGYPYRMAPTLPPFLKHISDRHEDEAKSVIIPTASVPSRPKMPHMPRIPPIPKISAEDDDDDDDDELAKRSDSIKKRQGLPYDADSSVSFDYSSYREPKYRNSHDLEFSPRRMYYESRGPYSRPSFSFPTLKPRPDVSPRDPYLSPSSEPIDGFYPKVKNNGVSTSYSTYGKRDKYYKSIADPVSSPPRVYGDDDDFSDISSEEDDFQLGQGGYVKSPKYQYSEPDSYSKPDTYSEPDPYSKPDTYSEPDPYSEPSPKEPVRAGGDSYDASYNSPITGITRKRLLEYAGASDLYGGEPDYLKSAAIRKTKFGSIQDDYHPYPRSKSYSFSDYHFDESRKVPSRAKRQVPQEEPAVPRCSSGTALPMCLKDDDYPTAEVKKMVSKNIKYLSQMKNTRLEINEKKVAKNSPEYLEDLKKNPSLCSSRKGHVYPKRAIDIDGIWRTVVNVDDVRQSIEVDVCRSTETPCDYLPAAIPTKCVQKFSFVTLITFNTEENILEHHDFPVPSACSCSVGKPVRVHLE